MAWTDYFTWTNLGSVIILIIGLSLIAINFYFNNRVEKVSNWPTVDATVTKLETISDLSGNYNLKIKYEFTTPDGTKAWGDNASIMGLKMFTPAEVKTLAASVAANGTVKVRYDPDAGAGGESYLAAGDMMYSGYIVGLLAVISSVGIYLHYSSKPGDEGMKGGDCSMSKLYY